MNSFLEDAEDERSALPSRDEGNARDRKARSVPTRTEKNDLISGQLRDDVKGAKNPEGIRAFVVRELAHQQDDEMDAQTDATDDSCMKKDGVAASTCKK